MLLFTIICSLLLLFVAGNLKYSGPDVLGTSSERVSDEVVFPVEHRDQYECEPYPLIGINQAHFVGLHTSSYSSNGLTPQIYFEWEINADTVTLDENLDSINGSNGSKEVKLSGQLDVPRFERAVNHFIQRHGTFRSVVRSDGLMQILTETPVFKMSHVHEWNGDYDAAVQTAANNRKIMMEIGPTAYSWPLFEIRVTHTSECSSIVHITVSLFLMDAMSDLILRQELSQLYRAEPSLLVSAVLPAPSKLMFKDYCIALQNGLHNSNEYQRAKEFWLRRLSTLSQGPELPMLVSGI